MGGIGEIEETERRMSKKAKRDETRVPERIQNVSSQPLEDKRHVERLLAWRHREALPANHDAEEMWKVENHHRLFCPLGL